VQDTDKAMREALAGIARDCYQNRVFTALHPQPFFAIATDRRNRLLTAEKELKRRVDYS